MKYLKMLGLAAVAAMALMAVVGVGTASADEVCTNASSPCNTRITTIEASQVGTGVLETTGGTELITCKAGDIHITITKQGVGVDPVPATVNALKFTECTNVVNTIANGTVNGSTSGTNGALTSVGAEVTTFILGVTCTYGTGAGTSLGTTSGTSLTVSTIVKKTAGGFLCPSEARWTASFKITNHNTVDWVNN